MARSETLHRALAVIPNRKTRLEQGASGPAPKLAQKRPPPCAPPTMPHLSQPEHASEFNSQTGREGKI